MSFILDALKKSESERQKKDTPGFADVPTATRRKSNSRWIWLVVALVAINLCALLILLLKANSVPEPDAGSIVNENSAEIVESEPATSFSDIVAEAKRSAPAVVYRSEESDTEQQVARAPDVVTPREEAAPETNTTNSSTPPPAPTAVTESHTTFLELRGRGVIDLPDLHLDIHVYSGSPADRFVFVNMSKYKENATLSEGPSIQAITPEGVILEYQGHDFLLPRE